MFSAEPQRGLWVAVFLAGSIGLAACTGAPPAAGPGTSDPASSVPSPSTSSVPGPSTSPGPIPSTARDGSTVLPTNEVSSCEVLGQERIQQVLGDAASDIQPGESSGSVDPSGIRRESCVYPLDAGRTTTHAVVVEVTTFKSAEELAAAGPFASMTDAVDVGDLSGPARFAVVRLSGSTEYVLVIANGAKLTRLIVSRPDAPWSSADGLVALKELAKSDKT
ncbi:MAG: hypothetical protein JWO49_786 [Arthrobacter sp.]|nr:hypothetical protein [Arthrobacter sp.]